MATSSDRHCASVVLRIALLSSVYWHIAGGTSVWHECVHDKIALKHVPNIMSKFDPDMDSGETGPGLPVFSKIRITVHYMQPLDEEIREELTIPDGPLMKAIQVMSNTLSVKPLQQNLVLPNTCNSRNKCQHIQNTTCGIFDVPSNFVEPTEVCNSSTDPATCVVVGGPGAVNTDFLLFVGTQPHKYCGKSTFAFSSTCLRKYHRPVVGYINFCTQNIVKLSDAERISTVFFNLILHELSHALGFSYSMLKYFHDGNLNLYIPNMTGTYNGRTIIGLNSTRVLQVGRSYFGCSNLSFVPLENNGKNGSARSHWEARVLNHETMNAFLSNDYAVFSNFTLAFFEDSGWYKVNYTFINNYDQFQLQWGRGLGCSFVLDPCTNETYPYFCDTHQRTQCTFDVVSKGRCESTFTYFDGCPVVLAYDNSSCIYEVNSPVQNVADEFYGTMSMCVDVAEETEGQLVPQCHHLVLEQHNEGHSQQSLNYGISLKNETYWCNDSQIIERRQGPILCPTWERSTLRVSQVLHSQFIMASLAPPTVPSPASTIPTFTAPTSTEDVKHTAWIAVGILPIAVLAASLILLVGIIMCYKRKQRHGQLHVHADDEMMLDSSSSDGGFSSDETFLQP